MGSEADDQHHGTESIWKELSHVRSQQAKTDERLGALEGKVDTGFSAMQRSSDAMVRNIESLRADINSSQPKPNYGLAVTVVISMLAMFGGYSTLINYPVSKQTESNAQSISAIVESQKNTVYTTGAHEKQLEWHQTWLSFTEKQIDDVRAAIADLSERTSRTEGRHEMLVDRVKDIDDKGSRRWNSDRDE